MNTLELVSQCKKDPQKSFTINFSFKYFRRNFYTHYFTEIQYGITTRNEGKVVQRCS